MRVPLPLTIGAATALIALAACGGSAATTQPTAGGTSPAGATATAGGGGGAGAAADVTCNSGSGGTAVSIVDFSFQPATSTADSNKTVTWTNNGAATHTVTFDNGKDCGSVASGATVTVTFSAAGSYPYHCTIHSSMKGTVTVSG